MSKLLIPKLPGVLDAEGRVAYVIGRQGSGPGEFVAPSVGTLKHDSTVIGDLANGLMLFDPQGIYVRNLGARVPGAQEVLLLRGDTLLLVQGLRTEQRFGFPFHILSPSGEFIRSFGADDRSIDPAFSLKEVRVIAHETDSTFWSARLDRYFLERWHISGTRLAAIQPERTWFPAMTVDPRPMDVSRPPARIESLSLDEHGHLVVLIQRARENWQPAARSETRIELARGALFADRLQFVEQLIEIVDPLTGSLYATLAVEDAYVVRLLRNSNAFGVVRGPHDREITTRWHIPH